MDPAAFFYTSCVRADGWPALTRFHTDLEYQLRIQEGFGTSGVLGALTDPESARESHVTRAGVMIALYSDRYFRDRGAGLEWAVFRSRMRHHEDTRGRPARSCLIPLCWKPVPDDQVPDAVRESASFPGAFDRLREHGLEALTALADSEQVERYYELVEQLAKTIAEAGRAELEPLDLADARLLDPAFGSESVPRPRRPDDPDARTSPHRPARPRPRPEAAEGERGLVAISYVGADQPWADWMKDALGDRGHRVVLRRWRAGHESLEDAVSRARHEAERVVVIFSGNYFGARETTPTEWAEALTDPVADSPLPVLVQIDATPRPLLMRDADVVALTGTDLAEAADLIDGALLATTVQRSEERRSGW